MKKLITLKTFLVILLGCVALTAQEKSIFNYSFQESNTVFSKQQNITLNMFVGKPVVGVSGSDNLVIKGSNFFNLKSQQSTPVNSKTNKLPLSYSLMQNYPNPFNPVTRIEYSIPTEGYVSISIYNMLGEKVKQLVDETKSPGNYFIDWDASGFSSGIYFYNIKSGNYSESRKLTLLR